MDTLEKVLRRWELKRQIPELEGKIVPLEKELFALYIEMHNQQADVDNLTSFSLKNWYLDVTGKKEGLMHKERVEAQRAKLAYDTAKRNLEHIQAQLGDIRGELKALRGVTDPCSDAAVLSAVKEEMEAARQHLTEVTELVVKRLESVRNLRHRNQFGDGTVNMMMPSYLASEQKRLNLLCRELALLSEDLSDLPVSEPVIPEGHVFLEMDERFLDELTSAIGRDTRLGQVDEALSELKQELEALAQKL